MTATNIKRKTPYPTDCTFTPQDWNVLINYWYPVAESAQVSDQPLAVTLLDVALVVYRAKGKRWLPATVHPSRNPAQHGLGGRRQHCLSISWVQLQC
ncbi:hypothetical protein NBRC111894_3651 [Sporolactobacillus inulinus]|uniref:Rieske domain-containing protein n=1 Tax=Sporolactobacillus inulinus TaxID=2078 RepID=A0A4Y1ZG25_9BACL|nr:hypothetical protein [Sporolactobacillus inulinus]GAY78097.1 hypothetical protein NBRC111894_3651 [Sporolactobacillus inulinus]